jgi:hypothetical protein
VPISNYEDRGLSPFEALLDNDPLPCGTELAGEGGPHGLLGIVLCMGHGYALPSRGPVGLHDDGVIVVRAQVG